MITTTEARDPGDELVDVGSAFATAHWREALGDDEPEHPPTELRWELGGTGPAEARLVVAHDGGPVGALLQRLPVASPDSSWIPWLYVVPPARGRGVARALLDDAVAAARERGRARLGWRTRLDDAAADHVARRAGARPEATLAHHRLLTADLDRPRLEAMVAGVAARHPRCSLVSWDGRCPDELVDRFAALQGVMDDAPASVPGAATTTAADVRRAEDRWLPRGPYWRRCVREGGEHGSLLAFSELQIPDARPSVAEQGDTGVAAPHRGRGLARWCKAANLLRLLDERPEVLAVDTTTAADNEAMIGLNRDLGFRAVGRWRRWELPL